MSWRMLRKLGCTLNSGDSVKVLIDLDFECDWVGRVVVVVGGRGRFVRVTDGRFVRSYHHNDLERSVPCTNT